MDDVYEYKLSDKEIKLLLNLYKERKCEFRDPNRKKKNVWREILAQMELQGIKGLDTEKIERKFRNLKQTYIKIKNKPNGQALTKFRYYNEMKDILSDDWTIAGGSTISSLSGEHHDPFHDNSKTPTVAEYLEIQSISDDEEESTSSFLKSFKQSCSQRNIANIEAERNECLARIANAMEESNRLFQIYLDRQN